VATIKKRWFVEFKTIFLLIFSGGLIIVKRPIPSGQDEPANKTKDAVNNHPVKS
jgi:hypothetical protein